jgi:hypothetical protein
MSARPSVDHAWALAIASELYRLLGQLKAKGGATFDRSYACSEDLLNSLSETIPGLTLRPAGPASTLALAHRYLWTEPCSNPVRLPEQPAA